MSKLLDVFKALHNGGGTVQTVEAEIDRLEKEKSAAQRKIVDLNDGHLEVLLSENDEAADTEERERVAAERVIDRCDLAVPRLRERLAAIRADAHQKQIADYRVRIEAGFDKLEAALMVALEANEAAAVLYDEACRTLGQNVAKLQLVPTYYGGMVNAAGIEHWARWCREALNPAKLVAAAHRAPVDATSKLGAAMATANYGESAAAPAPPSPPKLKRKPIQDGPREGTVQISIVRSGYEAPDGRSTAVGDVLALPPALAKRVVQAGAAEFL
jgi:hypothetical protein